ncbi:hypothetical protein [Salmonirosea aquatica]|uniref:Glycosyltransferase RgtA/B/C/D-like domain-containing protein n=1 Tax=Salmonirosea aquatica TaxID=2654236 RepID=A0A7C9BEV3_9BACT|nr:hypothetical protein [Cytophagaceae bacterium SJW1-29]
MTEKVLTKGTLGAAILILIPIVLFYVVSIQYSINVPWFDDFDCLPNFLLNWLNAETFSGKLEALFHPTNEHRIVSAHLVLLAQQSLMGTLNFRVMAFIGNLSVLGIFWLIALNFRKTETRLLWLLPAALLVFNLQYYAMTFMTIMTLQYQLVIFLSFLSLHYLAKGTYLAFGLAVGVALLDTYSMGNGMMVWPSGVVLLFFQGRWKVLGIWVILGVVAVFAYFYGQELVQGNEKGFAYILANPVKVLAGLLAMVGGIFDIFPTLTFLYRMLIPVLLGALMLGFGIYWLVMIFTRSEYWHPRIPNTGFVKYFPKNNNPLPDQDSTNAFWLGALTYLFISMALVVFFRTRFNYELVLWSTYKIYPGTSAAIAYLLLISLVPYSVKKYVFGGVLALALLAWGTSYYHYIPEVAKIRKVRLAFAFNQRHNGIGLGASKGTSFEPMVVRTLQGTKEKGVYQLPSPLIHPGEEDLSERFTEGNIKTTIRETDANVLITLPTHQASDLPFDRYAVLKSPRNIYLFYVQPTQGLADCPKATLHSGVYTVEIWEAGNQHDTLLATDQTVIIP